MFGTKTNTCSLAVSLKRNLKLKMNINYLSFYIYLLLFTFSFGNLRADCNKGVELRKNGQFRKALTELNKCIKDNPNEGWLYNERGICYSQLGNQKSALVNFKLAHKLNPGKAEILNNIGIALEEQHKFKDALEYYHMALSIDSNYSDSYFNMGRTFDKEKLFDSAEFCYRQVWLHNPNDKEVQIVLAMLNSKYHHFREAIEMETQVIHQDSTDIDQYYYRAEYYDSIGEFQAAILDYDTFLIKVKNNFDYSALCNRGIIKSKIGNNQGAIYDFTKAINGNPEELRAYTLRMRAFNTLGDTLAACADFKQIRKLGGRLDKDLPKGYCR